MASEFLEHFERVARDRADEVLLWAPQEGRSLRAADILAEADAFRRALRGGGLGAGGVVLAALGNRSAFVPLTLACFAEGWPLLAVDGNTPLAEVRTLMARWSAAALVLADAPGPLVDAHAVDALPGGVWGATLMPRPDGHRFGRAVLLKLTSGSTGTPKVTLTEERHLVADVAHITAGMDIGPRTRQLGVIPLSHSYGFSNLVLPLFWQGSPLLLHPGFVPGQIAADAAAFGTETWAGVPFMFEHVARLDAPFPRSIRTVISAGARLPYEVVEAFHRRTGCKVHSFYGSSETGGICYDDTDTLWPDVPVGRPLGAALVTIREDADAPPGSGRVVVHGPNVIDGYADGADADAFDEGGFVTSDFGRFTSDGLLLLTGRCSSAVNIAGRKVLPGDVEAAMRAVPGVQEVAVVGLHDERRGQTLGACFVAGRRISVADMRAALAPHLAAYKLPRVIVQVEALPLTGRGKLDRSAVVDVLERARRATAALPADR
jgi:acyl-CoA synthetase (AMP-forming)/AMP-acid ligase II